MIQTDTINNLLGNHLYIYIYISNQIKSNQSLLLSHHHSTSALVSEILMSVLQTVQKNNRQFTYGQTVQKKQQQDNLHMDRQCKKLHWSIYSAPDSAKNNNSNVHMDRQCKKQQQFTYGQYIFTDCTEDNVQNTTYIYSVHIVSIKTYLIINDTLYTVWAHLHYVQYLYIM